MVFFLNRSRVLEDDNPVHSKGVCSERYDIWTETERNTMTDPVNNLRLSGQEVRTVAQLRAIYQERIATYGFSGKIMVYPSEAQRRGKITQFGALLQEVVNAKDSLLDIGCGYGSLVRVLPHCTNLGIDIVPEFINHAKQQYRSMDFQLMDVRECLGQYEWCVLAGVVNSSPEPGLSVNLAWERCTKGVVVDFIDRNKMTIDGEEDATDVPYRFDCGSCVNRFLQLGAEKVEVFTTPNMWTILLAHKQQRWGQRSVNRDGSTTGES